MPELRARAGVTTGEAAVTIGVDAEGMVAGDLVNTASRVQTVARPGSVFVGEATRSVCEAAIVYEDAGEHELKGKAEPVALWRAARVVAAAGGAQRSSALEPPFVGRDRELRMVKELFHASADGGKAQLLSVVGGAGIGKSRLVWEFFRSTSTGSRSTPAGIEAAASPTARVSRYWALAEMVRTNASDPRGRGRRDGAAEAASKRSRSPSPTRRSGAGSSRGSRVCSVSSPARPATAKTCSRPGGFSTSASPKSCRP